MADKSIIQRYAAKGLFQFRVMVDGDPGKRRLTEERIFLLSAKSANAAHREALRFARSEQYQTENDEGNPVYFEFIGLMDLLHLGIECQENEVWYDIRERVLPMERQEKLIPKKEQLSAFLTE